MEGGSEMGERAQGPLFRKGCTWRFVQGPSEFLFTPLLMVCLLSRPRVRDRYFTRSP